MRLTKKIDLDKGKPSFYEPEHQEQYSTKEKRQAINKLGRLEDAEDDLGIDLPILFKALREGIWVRYDDTSLPERDNAPELIHLESPRVNLRHEYGEWAIAWFADLFKLCDYGKTWALTEAELGEKQRDNK